MTRIMIDTDHSGLPSALAAIRALPSGSLVAMYDTGSPDIISTPTDWAEIPGDLTAIVIDQGFTGSPNLKANVRDCENGAWSLDKAVDRTGWVPEGGRPTLYLGFPDTAKQAYDLGWRGDVWIALSSDNPPTAPPLVPPDLNVVGIQWNFKDPAYDVSVIFDPTWPGAKVVTPPPPVTATVPPGQWKNPGAWSWKEVLICGIGEDGNFYTYAYDPTENLWLRQSLPNYERD